MIERFRKKKQPEVIHIKYEIVPPFDYEGKTDKEVKTYFESLSRPQVLEIFDRDTIPEEFHDTFFEVENEIKHWPTDDNVISVCNELRWNSDSVYHKFKETEKQIEGMQKKLDKIETLISNAEFKLCGKEAMKL